MTRKPAASYDREADAIGVYFAPEDAEYDGSEEVAPELRKMTVPGAFMWFGIPLSVLAPAWASVLIHQRHSVALAGR